MSTLKNNEQVTGRAYHHGDLRETLIELGAAMLGESGEAALSLRKLAARAGVSHNAPYQHFADKDALIAAIAEQGFRRLGAAIDAARAAHADAPPRDRLVAVGRAYVAFGLAHRAHLQVMFGGFPNSQYPALAAEARATLDRLIAVAAEVGAAEGLGNGRGEGEALSPAEAAAVVWMTVHGLSAILIADKLPDDIARGRPPEVIAERFVRLICAGLLAR